eukprot:TRINITY_DN110597_c0_g1_i1.p1 TRINITY_DN110597_c0_g1~~TRINITY_DN110597_c0_g1_i1.p1  ORF type:complete len:299 (-),score=32.03 TRINITY_DN110597_c0_g1_i1:23-919(-)
MLHRSNPPTQLSFISSESSHQRLQRTLGVRETGGPHEQIRSRPARLRFTRSCDILHSTLEEPLSLYKSLEPQKPHWSSTWRRYHLNDGIRVVDQDTAVISAKDTVQKTKKGLMRTSSGSVTYSNQHRLKVELDVLDLAQFLKEGVPGGAHEWTCAKLERFFRERTGRIGSWAHYDVGFIPFCLLFPKTFELFGPGNGNIRLTRKVSSTVIDNIEDVLVRLARGRETGTIDKYLSDFQDKDQVSVKAQLLPALQKNRFKASYKLGGSTSPSTTMRSTRPADAVRDSDGFSTGFSQSQTH